MSPPVTRTRDVLYHLGKGRLEGSDTNNSDPTQVFKFAPSYMDFGTIKGTQVTVSEGHPFQGRNKSLIQDLGGEFFTEKTYVDAGNSNEVFQKGGTEVVASPTTMAIRKDVNGYNRKRNYSGPMLPTSPSNMSFPPSIKSSNAQLDALGATAIARCKPTNSVADASTFLGELFKDGLPHLVGSTLWKDKTSKARNKAAEEFLNVEFGWLPIASDIKKFAKAVTHADAVLSQYERDAGKVVRRHYSFPVQRTVSESNQGIATVPYYGPSDSTFEGGSRGTVLRRVETVRRQWFSGAFTYALPTGLDSRSKMGKYALEAKKLYGLSLTPETVWNLAPWSWAVDWFSNTGDVISNISDWATDGLVMHYGYMMEHTISKHTYSLSPTGLLDPGVKVHPFSLVRETKVRRRANPFGFGLTWDGLSPVQVAIAAAIGLVRS